METASRRTLSEPRWRTTLKFALSILASMLFIGLLVLAFVNLAYHGPNGSQDSAKKLDAVAGMLYKFNDIHVGKPLFAALTVGDGRNHSSKTS